MNSTFQTSESIKTIAQALMTFRSNVETIKKDGKNPFFRSKYATLSNILNVVANPLENAGLVFSQFPDGENGLTTILIHPESGEFMQSTFDMHIVKNDPQAMGSAITYARRYALGAILGLNIDEDDDGNKATPPQENKPYKANNDDNKPWLNKGTAEFVAAHKAILSGEYKISDVRKKYKVGKEVANLLTQTIDAN